MRIEDIFNILIIDDNDDIQKLYDIALHHNSICTLQIFSAYTIEEAEDLFNKHSSKINVIIMDACLGENQPNTIELVKKFRKKFKGPIVASSEIVDFRRMLIQAGCNAEYNTSKDKVPQKILELQNIHK